MGAGCFPSCYPTQNKELIQKMQKAFLQIGFNCDQASLESIIKLVAGKPTTVPLELEKCTAQHQLLEGKGIHHETYVEIRLIIKLKQGQNAGKRGLIIYKWGYYIGNIVKNMAEDHQGTMVYFKPSGLEGASDILHLTIKGEWKDGDLFQGKGYKSSGRQWFSLKWNTPGRDISLNFHEGDIKSYNGIINLDLSGNLVDILSGMATIIFSDGSSYKGRVKKGIMDTQQGEDAIFQSIQEKETYMGPYRNGQRNGRSLMKKKIQNTDCTFEMVWNEGKPDHTTFRVQDRNQVDDKIRIWLAKNQR